jgi:glycosyltransferase involved in cell wall biosynthesis
MPRISVIVPARNSAATIGRTLSAVAAQRVDDAYEVVVVDDASSDDTGAIAQAAGARVVRHELPQGSARSRNAGAAAASGEILAFTDADCEPQPGWLGAGLAVLRGADLVQGRVIPEPGVQAGPFAKTLEVTGESGLFESANLFVTREAFVRAGGFGVFLADRNSDGPGLRPPISEGHFGEDALLGWRLRRHGGLTAFSEEALVHHAVHPRGPRGFLRERWRVRYFPALVREIPELRDHLAAGVFLSRRSALFDAALAGTLLAATTGRRWPLLAWGPYASEALRGRDLWRRSVWRENAVRVSADAVSLVALVFGSARAGRLVL